MEKFISSEMEKMGMEERIHAIREDLPGDALASAKLVKAAKENNGEEVEKLLLALCLMQERPRLHQRINLSG